MRIVIDTNIIASAVFFGGNPRRIIEALFEKKLEAFITPEILEEYHETFEELQIKYQEKRVYVPVTQIAEACRMIIPNQTFEVCRDPDDNKFIDCAYAGKCIYIVTGDKDLLDIRKFKDIEIVTAVDFCNKYL